MYARISPRSFLLSRANSCATTTRSVHAYISARPRPANSISALDSRNSWICSWFKYSAFCIVNCIRPKHAATPSFMLMLHWNQLRFNAHLALDNSLMRWTSKSLRHLSEALQGLEHSACPHVIADCLRELGYSLQANSKTREGSGHVDRDAQFQYISNQARAFVAADEPVISVDTKEEGTRRKFQKQRPRRAPQRVSRSRQCA